MANEKFKDTLLSVLKADERLWQDGEFNQTRLFDLVDKHDAILLKLLLDNTELKAKFFVKVNDIFIFKGQDFKFFLDENKLDNSYTQFENIIGLKVGSKMLKDRDEVVLNFPFKDCVLQGGQSRDEGTDIAYEYNEKLDDYVEMEAKRKEVFFNEILAKDEIDRLEAPKVLKNWKRYTKDGEVAVGNLQRDEDGIIQENLIIKGNNLLALHSIKKEFAGKVKLIYIDPPYNTGSDSFKYNDNFNHSTWLTFMKNRLEIAYELLRDDGVIFVQCDDNEQAYLKVLMDGIFGPDNFINHISIKTKSPSGFKTVNLGVFETAEYIYLYGKNKKQFKYKVQYVESSYDTNYKYQVSDRNLPCSKWTVMNIEEIIANAEGFDNVKDAKKSLGKGVFLQKQEEYALENAQTVFRYTEINDDAGKDTIEAKNISKTKPSEIICVKRNGMDDRYIHNGNEIYFYSKKVRNIDGNTVPTMLLSNLWTDIPYEGIANEGGVKLKKGKKPEKLLKRLIDMSTDVGDLVLDYHLGSGTTAAVSHKMGRQYIGIEQISYGDNDCLVRLNNVMNSDQSGISKALNWKGGGEFVYFELAEWNEEAKRFIQDAKNIKELEAFFDTMYERYFLNYNVKSKEFKEKVLGETKFRSLPLEKQKDMFIRMLDLNQMYVNYTERNDKKFGISGDDISLSEGFYKN